jgi:hypothetical protein
LQLIGAIKSTGKTHKIVNHLSNNGTEVSDCKKLTTYYSSALWRYKISLHLCFCKQNMLVNTGIILSKFQLLSDPPRILALHIEESSASCRNQPDED